MRLSEVWRTTTFRLSLLYGLLFAVGAVALLAMVYLQSAVYLTHRVDGILRFRGERRDAHASGRTSPDDRRRGSDQRPHQPLRACSPPTAREVTGNLRALPGRPGRGRRPRRNVRHAGVSGGRANGRQAAADRRGAGGRPRHRPAARDPADHRLGPDLERRPDHPGRAWPAASALSLGPLRRLRAFCRTASHDIAAGDLRRRMPSSGQGDELDMFAGTVNYMMGEVERLMAEVKTASDTIAHDLRTPLTRARAQLHRLAQSPKVDPADIGRRHRRARRGAGAVPRHAAHLRAGDPRPQRRLRADRLGKILEHAGELYQPLAEEAGVQLSVSTPPGARGRGRPEAAVRGGQQPGGQRDEVHPRGRPRTRSAGTGAAGPRIIVEDNGPGVPPEERTAVLQRFYRSERDQLTPGSGLGLSIVAAIVRLHRFGLELQDPSPDLRVVIDCRSPA